MSWAPDLSSGRRFASRLGAGWGARLFAVLAGICVATAVATLRLSRHLPAAASHVPVPAPATAPETSLATVT